MNTSRGKKLFTLALLALFLWPAVPAVAGEIASQAQPEEFDLHLDKALSRLDDELSGIDLGPALSAGENVTEEPVQIATLSSTAVSDVWRSSQAVAVQSSGSSDPGKKRSFWKKKKWWIPVVAAVALGVALGSDDGDDSIDDGED
jgi:hypothetical protein